MFPTSPPSDFVKQHCLSAHVDLVSVSWMEAVQSPDKQYPYLSEILKAY